MVHNSVTSRLRCSNCMACGDEAAGASFGQKENGPPPFQSLVLQPPCDARMLSVGPRVGFGDSDRAGRKSHRMHAPVNGQAHMALARGPIPHHLECTPRPCWFLFLPQEPSTRPSLMRISRETPGPNSHRGPVPEPQRRGAPAPRVPPPRAPQPQTPGGLNAICGRRRGSGRAPCLPPAIILCVLDRRIVHPPPTLPPLPPVTFAPSPSRQPLTRQPAIPLPGFVPARILTGPVGACCRHPAHCGGSALGGPAQRPAPPPRLLRAGGRPGGPAGVAAVALAATAPTASGRGEGGGRQVVVGEPTVTAPPPLLTAIALYLGRDGGVAPATILQNTHRHRPTAVPPPPPLSTPILTAAAVTAAARGHPVALSDPPRHPLSTPPPPTPLHHAPNSPL